MSLQEHLYANQRVNPALDGYIKELSGTGEIDELLHANKLVAYRNLINDKQFLRNARKLFNGIYDLIEKNHPALQFHIAGRRKAVISTEKKILQYQKLGKSLDLIKDFIAFRIILFGDDSIDIIYHCYQVLQEIIGFAANCGFTPCERLPLIDVANPEEPQNEYFAASKYKEFVKDYICFPKKNGYRSLHLGLVDTKGRDLEIQIRPLDIHAEVESGEANHRDYKSTTYADEFPLEREKIAINGYKFVDGNIFDYAGIEFPIEIFQRQKTF